MSIRQQYALFDHTAQMFLNSLVFTNDGDAIRWFTTVINDDKEPTNINKYPHQFTLYRLSDYDDKTGLYVPRKNENEQTSGKPKELITGVQVVKEENQLYSIKEIIQLIKQELNSNVTDIKEAKN
jgi:hypothetical protein